MSDAATPFRPYAAILLVIAMILVPGASEAQDTIVVRSVGPPAWGSEITLVEELRIGALDGVDEELFGTVMAVAILPDSSIWIGDTQVPVVRGFRADGSFIGNAGGPGEGPGEFQMVTGAFGQPDGTLVVWDHWGGRISIFDSDGAVLSSRRILESHRAGDDFQIDADGHWYILTRMWQQLGPQDDPVYSWIRYAPDGTVLDTIPAPAPDVVGGGFVIAAQEGHLGPFPIQTMHTIGNAGEIITARNSEYAFDRPLPDGRILRVERSYTPVEVGAEEHRQWEAYRRYIGEERAPEMFGAEEEFDRVPRVKPPFRKMWLDGDGRLWFHRYTDAVHQPASDEVRARRGDRPLLEWREPPVHDLFDRDGAYLAQVTLPPRTLIRAASGRHIWAQQAGEFGEAYIVRFRIDAPNLP